MNRNRGAVLLLALWVLVILSIVTLHLVQLMRYETFAAGYSKEEVQARALAEAGLARLLAELKVDTNAYDAYTEPWFRETLAGVGEKAGDEATPREPVSIDQDNVQGRVIGTYSVRIEDEAAKFSLNSSVPEEQRAQILAAIVQRAGGTEPESVADCILDWMDPDDFHRLNGAEGEDYYLKLAIPYECKNGPLDTIDELLLVKGVTPEMMNGREGQPGLRSLVTVYTGGQINLNTASKELLEVLLGSELAGAIVARRAGPDGLEGTDDDEPFKTTAELQQMPEYAAIVGSGALIVQLGVQSSFLTVEATGATPNGRTVKRIHAVIAKQPSQAQVVYWRET